MSWILQSVTHALLQWGYLALFVGIFGEEAGLPLPGETVLMLASFLAHKSNRLALPLLILVGIVAAILGDNLGYIAGKRLGPRLLRWLRDQFNMEDDLVTAAAQIRRHGPATIFWSRYIAGLRIVAGPVAGALGMEWKLFLLWNAMGAVTWVTSMALIGYAFASHFQSLLGYFAKASWIVTGAIFVTGYLLWRRQKKQLSRRAKAREKAALDAP